jgi:hypothetical protein
LQFPGFGRAISLLHVAITRLKQKGDQAMTQTTKHTPGPWQDNDAGLIYGQVSADDDEAPFICDVCDNQPDYTEREKANARLIAAAPELLTALKGTLFALDENMEGGGPTKAQAIADALAALLARRSAPRSA